MARALAVAVLVGAVLVTGCGPLDRAELSRGVQTLSALAAEGELVADGVAQDRTRATYARVQAATLADDASHEAEKLADATPAHGLDGERDAAVALAQRLDDTIGELETFPGGEQIGVKVRDELMSISDQLDQLTHRLAD